MKELQYFQVKMSHEIEFVYTNSSISVSYLEVSQGDFILSPYGMWTFQIQNIPGMHRSFNKLKSFLGKVEVMLVRTGTFLWENSIDFEKLDLKTTTSKLNLTHLVLTRK